MVTKITLSLAFICTSLFCFGQFKLTGKILSAGANEDLQINVPLIFGFYAINSTPIPVAKDGSFSIILPIKEKKFATLTYQNKSFSLLLQPQKSLTINLNKTDSTLRVIAGSALAENKLIQDIKLRESPYFLNDDGSMFNKLNIKEVQEKVVQPFFSAQARKTEIVKASSINSNDKILIASELKFRTYSLISLFYRTAGFKQPTVDSLIVSLFDNVKIDLNKSPVGPYYFEFIDNYLMYLESKAFVKIKTENILSNQLIPYYGISLDSAKKIVEQNGKSYWRWIGSINNLPLKVVEPYTYQAIVSLYQDKDLRPFQALTRVFRTRFPTSRYLGVINKEESILNKLLKENENNVEIKIVADFEKMTSIYDVIKPHKGKVIYLDIWGTWCGPCKEELQYIPSLKATFKDKDVVFVYLDMDEDVNDSKWREFIKVNGLTGLHLRKGRKTIDPFWKELLVNAPDKAEYYPQYFIFDKDGKLAIAKAERPSSGEELYTQLNIVLKQK